jgi:ribosome-associated translation inhibitor RaiA
MQTPDVQVETRGEVPPNMAEYAQSKIMIVAAHTRKPVPNARVKLIRVAPQAGFTMNALPDRGAYAPVETAVAKATLNVNGRLTRAHAAAESMHGAIDLLKDRLEKRLARIERNWEARRGAMPVKEPPEWRHGAPIGEHWKEHHGGRPGGIPNEWRHGSEPTQRPDHYPRPADERQLVRHKSYSLARETPDEAAFEMESMDYDFHLFTDLATGQDTVIYRTNPHGYRMAQVQPSPDLISPDAAVPLTLSTIPAPLMSVPEAEERLDITGFPFAFFADETSGRGSILYHRYDGHYGLITPAE